MNRDPHQNIVRTGFRVFDEDIEITVVIEQARVQQFKFRLIRAAPVILLDELRVGKFRLRILVKHLEIGMGRCGIEVIIQLLHILAVVALGVGQAKQTLLENWVFAIPHCERKAEVLHVVAETGDAIFAPAIGAAAGVIVRQIFPCVAAG